jgi:hypothetical protein
VKLVVGGSAEDDVVGAVEGHDLKRDHLFAEIIDIAEGHGKSDAAKGVCLFITTTVVAAYKHHRPRNHEEKHFY